MKRGGRVYAKIVPDALSAISMPIVERKAAPDSIRTIGTATYLRFYRRPDPQASGDTVPIDIAAGRL